MFYAAARAVARASGSRYMLKQLDRYALWRWGEPEIRMLPVLGDRDGWAIDVGANLGEYTLFLERYFGTVIAVDANPACVRMLRKKFGAHVRIEAVGLSDSPGSLELYVTRDGTGTPGMASFESTAVDRSSSEVIQVPVTTLDDLLSAEDRGNVSLIKIDVEGHELPVLRGAEALITAARPNVLVESEARHSAGAPFSTFEFLLANGYDGWFIHGRELCGIKSFSVEKHQDVSNLSDSEKRRWLYSNNFLFSVDRTVPRRLARALSLNCQV